MPLVTKKNLYDSKLRKIRSNFQNTKNDIIEISDKQYQELSIYGLDYINENNIITYEAPEKLLIVNESSFNNPGVQALSFNTEIINHTFENGIGKLIFENELTEIKEKAFFWCKSITKLYLPNSIKIIKNNVFYGCQNLNFIKIPNNLIFIGGMSFMYCKQLNEIEFFNVKEFGWDTFSFDPGSRFSINIILHETIPPILENKDNPLGCANKDNDDYKVIFYVPLESLDLYIADEKWNTYNIQPIQI